MRTEELEPPLFMFGYAISRHGIIISFGIGTSKHASVITMEDSDFDAWKKSIREHLKREASSTVTIPKVPERLRRLDKDAYEPQIISFGPYHNGRGSLQAMEKYKWSFLEVILSFRPEIPRQRYINAIKEEEAKIRTCYTDDYDIDSEEFVEMMLIDGCFVVGNFLKFYYGPVSDELDSMVWMHRLIQNDILLLENQLPFFILIKIFDLLQFTPTSRPSSFMDLANHYLNWVAGEEKVNFQPPESVHHLLHLYHSHCLYTQPVSTPIHQHPSATVLHEEDSISVPIDGEKSDPRHRPQPPGATVLYKAGVKFEKKEVKGSSSLDVVFDGSNGKMMIPPLVIDSFTKSRLRNLVAFEQLDPNFYELDRSFTAYVEFMNFIVNTPEDVALLRKKAVIRHFLSSDKNAANFFNDLNQGVFVKPGHYLAPLYEAIYNFQKKRVTWREVGIGAGSILLVLTVVQTIFSGYPTF